jgi:hypothetical protein
VTDDKQLAAGIPSDKSKVDEYLKTQSAARLLIVQWLEDFKSKFEVYEEAQLTIIRVENALQQYHAIIGSAQLKIDIQKARDARKAQGSVLEYGLDYHLEKFINAVSHFDVIVDNAKLYIQLKSGIPSDQAKADEYVDAQTKEYQLLLQWLEDFKSKFGDYDEAKATITQVEEALKLYKDVVLAAKLSLDIQRARAARRAQGSVLEYGLQYHHDKFNNNVIQCSL